ncbi:MAG: hypothetical protein N3B18_05400 [Desulfobacterota bacterium]|nr:hypothetical protein [Thermodesulfobacteriota bacterium]
MISAATLTSAKAFLCWDVFENTLAVQLVPIRTAVAYYYPPLNPHHGIVVFYSPQAPDLSEALFLLFHEAGHVRQWIRLHEKHHGEHFCAMIERDKGAEKIAFEQEAWHCGKELLERFVQHAHLDPVVLEQYDLYGQACLLSYADGRDRRSTAQ